MGIDLLDREIAAVTHVMLRMNEEAKRTPNSPSKLKDFGKRIQDEFYKIGLIVNVDLSACGLINPKTGRTFPPDVEIMARVDDHTNTQEFDHEQKRFEVLDALDRGEERYRGVRETVNRPRNARAKG